VFNQNDDRKKKLFLKMLRGTVEFLGVAPSQKEMDESNKHIFVFPDEVGFLQTRRNEIGTFTVPAGEVFFRGQSDNAKLELNLPKLPVNLLHQTVSLFDQFMAKTGMSRSTLEAFVQIFWDRQKEEYFIHVPEQLVSMASVRYINTQEIMKEHLLVMDIHSHNDMSAFFSGTDDGDEVSTRLFGVVGKMNDEWPQASFRMGVAGQYHYLDISDVFDIVDSTVKSVSGDDGRNILEGISRDEDIPSTWLEMIKVHNDVTKEKLRLANEEKHRNKKIIATNVTIRDFRSGNVGGGEQLELSLLDDPNVEEVVRTCGNMLYEDPFSIAELLLDHAGNDTSVATAFVEYIGEHIPGVIEAWLEENEGR